MSSRKQPLCLMAFMAVLSVAFLAGLAASWKTSRSENRLHAAEPPSIAATQPSTSTTEGSAGPFDLESPSPQTAVHEILQLREALGAGPLEGSDLFNALPLGENEELEQEVSERKLFARQLRALAGEPASSEEPQDQPADVPAEPTSTGDSENHSECQEPCASERCREPGRATQESSPGPAWWTSAEPYARPFQPQQVSVLRQAAFELEQAAHLLELQDLYDASDELREMAGRLRGQARSLGRQRSRLATELPPERVYDDHFLPGFRR